MPSLNEHFEAGGQLNRIMIYGPSQSYKTWWAGTVAEAGYNVLFLDGDGNPGTLRNLSTAARQRIYYVDIQDSRTSAVNALFMTLLLQNHNVWFSEEEKTCFSAEVGGHTHFDIRNWNSDFVIIVDSYTALANSAQFQYALENKINLADAEKDEWPGYGWMGRFLTWALESFGKLPCHVIVICHAVQYEKHKKTTDANGYTRLEVEWSRRQPASSSGPHGMQVGRQFGETYYFYQRGSAGIIEPFGDQWADGGSRVLPRQQLQFSNFKASDCFKMLGTPLPPPDLAPIGFYKSTKKTMTEIAAEKSAARTAAKSALTAGQGAPAVISPGLNAKKPSPFSTAK